MERIKQLIELLNKASKAYYQEDREIMSNLEYDKLYDELESLEKDFGVVFSSSPTRKVGFEVLGSLKKVSHETRMLSLDKTKDIEKLKSFLSENIGLISYKIDGLTIVLKYNNGFLQQAITRGNGEIGEDVTHNAQTFKNLPIKIEYKEELILRGEAVIKYSDFQKLNDELEPEEQYKNPRNLCSGTVRQLNNETVSKRHVMFVAFSLVKADGLDFDDKKSNQHKWLSELGFDVVESKLCKIHNVEEIVKDFESKIPSNEFGSDGLVLTYDSISYSNSLGVTSKFPKDSIAFKWADEKMETTLLDVEWNTSRTGLINPIAIFEPVELEGTTVNRASLHNISYIEGLSLGIGDTISVYKANMIIPQVAENITKNGGLLIPKTCPVCEEEAHIIKQKEGKALYCVNPNCKAQLVRALVHYTSRNATNIEHMSEATIEKFVEKGFLRHYIDIYSIQEYEIEIKDMDGFGEKSYHKLIDSIEKSKKIAIPNFIHALGINQVGLSNAKLLCSFFDYDLQKIRNAPYDEIASIKGFGEIIADSLTKYFSNSYNSDLLDEAISILDFVIPEIKGQLLTDKIFVITGDVNIFANRKELQNYIESQGGKVTASITSKTSYLINNNINSNSSKNKKARELGIPILSEADFIDTCRNDDKNAII